MQEAELSIEQDADISAMKYINDGLWKFNVGVTKDASSGTVRIALRSDDGEVRGGLLGDIIWGWLHIHILFVDKQHSGKGWGRKLLAEAERQAQAAGCQAVHLDTFSWQALGFYEKMGYSVFGKLEGYPPGYSRYYLKKLF